METRRRSNFALFGGGLLCVLGTVILVRAVRPAPGLEDLERRSGTIQAVEVERVSSGKTAKRVLRVDLDDGAEPIYVPHGAAAFAEVVATLRAGDAITARVEPHARQLLQGTPLARGRTEIWELRRTARGSAEPEGTAEDELLMAFEDARTERTRDRAGWGFAAGATLLVGLYGLSQARGRG